MRSYQSIEANEAVDASPRMGQMKSKDSRLAIDMTVATRRQTAVEQRRFEAALQIFLAEIVRQEIAARKEGSHEGKATQR